MEVGEAGNYIYLPLHCHHQSDSCIKTGSDKSHVNGSLILKDSHKRMPTTSKEKGEPKRIRTEAPSAYQPNALPLGQTGSHYKQNDADDVRLKCPRMSG